MAESVAPQNVKPLRFLQILGWLHLLRRRFRRGHYRREGVCRHARKRLRWGSLREVSIESLVVHVWLMYWAYHTRVLRSMWLFFMGLALTTSSMGVLRRAGTSTASKFEKGLHGAQIRKRLQQFTRPPEVKESTRALLARVCSDNRRKKLAFPPQEPKSTSMSKGSCAGKGSLSDIW